MNRSGPELALLLLAGFRSMVDAGTAELAKRGHPDVRASHDFAMRAIIAGADSAGELGRRLSVSKQAAAKTIIALEERGYITREVDAVDSRRKQLVVTPRGLNLLETGQEIFDGIWEQWQERIGVEALAILQNSLRTVVGGSTDSLDTFGWLVRTSGAPG